MITIELNDQTADDVKCIEELRSLGFSEEFIQELYDSCLNRRKENEYEPITFTLDRANV